MKWSRVLSLCLFAHKYSVAEGALSIPINLSPYFNGKAASTGPGDHLANFDGSGRAYPVQFLPKGGTNFSYEGIEFFVPPFDSPTTFDFIRSNSQVIDVIGTNGATAVKYQSFHALAAAVWTPSGFAQANPGNLTFQFADGSVQQSGIIVGPWFSDSPFNGPIHTPWHYANATLDYNTTIDHNITHILYTTVRINNSAPLEKITLSSRQSFINWFAITLRPAANIANASDNKPLLDVQNMRSTTKWMNGIATGSARVQQVEILLDNLAAQTAGTSSWLDGTYSVNVTSNDLQTVIPGSVIRLRSNDQVLVKVGVRNKPGVPMGSNTKGVATVIDAQGNIIYQSGEFPLVAGIPEYESTDESLGTHETPEWFDEAKFGIFIHWGVYSVPAWAPTGQQYAEWYNWQARSSIIVSYDGLERFLDHSTLDAFTAPNAGSPTWVHHRQTYGPNIIYDDFIANWTAEAWDPDDWVDLFNDAGAKYFVLVTKHHDGFALFDTGNVSNRNAVKMGPKRDLVRDLMDAAKERHPEMHRGTYFSLPEWFNPDYKPYARTKFPGQPDLYAFNHSCCEPYTGWVHQDDFITGVQKPELEALFYQYETEILWCDADGKSAFGEVAAEWYNTAASQGRQVTRSNRCGVNTSDWVTPEYVTYPARLSQKWESSAGMDPFSYGYNSDTPPDAYQNASSLIAELIDIVSKGGNFLLDIGPAANGSVITEERGPLLEIGRWLKQNGEAIYSTTPWYIQQADISTSTSTSLRFTTTRDAFYVIILGDKSVIGQAGGVSTNAPLPILPGDHVTVLGVPDHVIDWSIKDNVISFNLNEEDLPGDYAWSLKIEYA